MRNINIHKVNENELPYNKKIEIVERKGLGHPDTITDNLAEIASIELSKYYIDKVGFVLHHNLDKALLVGGVANPKYNGGELIEPIDIELVGRATKEFDNELLAVDEVVIKAMHDWIRAHLPNIDPENHITIKTKIRPGSKDLVELFERFALKGEAPLANDTSFGVGFYPFDKTEQTAIKIENLLNSPSIKSKYPFIGEDIKVMVVRNNEKIKATIAMATIDKHISSLEDYINKIESVKELLKKEIDSEIEYHINTADSYENESIYLTVTGTSAEHGDDGQVGRGNRVNGIITPYRPMSLEAAAGKNPISHVGKIYNFFANDLSKAIVEQGLAEEAIVYIVSQIGKPINEPQALDIKLKGFKEQDLSTIQKLAEEHLDKMPEIWKDILKGKYKVA